MYTLPYTLPFRIRYSYRYTIHVTDDKGIREMTPAKSSTVPTRFPYGTQCPIEVASIPVSRSSQTQQTPSNHNT